MIFSNTLVALALALSASALTTGHAARNVHHRGLAARMPHPDPVAQSEFVQVTPLKKRSNSGRCKTRSSSSAAASSTAVSSSSAPASSSAAANVGNDPPTFASSTSEAPKTSSEAPKTTSTSAPKTTSEAAAPKTTSASSSGSSDEPSFLVGTQSGDGTFFAPGLGACGITNSGTDMIAAISHQVFDGYPGATANPNDNPICGKKVTAHYQGKSVTVTITDRCAGCLGSTDLDFAPSAFDVLADADLGRIGITWDWDD